MQTACCRAQLRASEDLPLIVLASVPDKEFALVLCRDAKPQRDGDYLQALPVPPRARPPPCLLIGDCGQGLADRVHDWPLRDFAPLVELPFAMCQRQGCNAYAAAPACLSEPYAKHQSPSQRDLDAAVKQAGRQRWREEYAAKAEAETAAVLSSSDAGAEEEVVRDAVTKRVEAEMERVIRQELSAAQRLPKLRGCTRCRTGAFRPSASRKAT